MQDSENGLLDDRKGRPYVAVASMEGILINQHLGEAENLWIFEYDEIEARKLVEMREAPEPGDGKLALARAGQDDLQIATRSWSAAWAVRRAGCWNRAACA